MKTKKLVQLALLTAVALIVFVIEAQIPAPVPIPGVKLGLSNVITLFTLCAMGPREALAVLLLRCVIGSVITGQLSMLAYSLSGGLLSLAVMLLLRRITTDRQIFVVSVFGGIAHNCGQLGAAILMTETPGLLYYLPVLLLCGIAAGLFTGLAAQAVCLRLRRLFPKT